MTIKGFIEESSPDYLKVYDFINDIKHCDNATWLDEAGTTEVVMGRNILPEFLNGSHVNIHSFISPIFGNDYGPLLKFRKINTTGNHLDYVISIGSAFEHNVAKEYVFKFDNKRRPKLITIPVPLANDSFGTNRSNLIFNQIENPARETVYPSNIILDLGLLENIEQRLNLIGVGEVIGLYYSIYDYHNIKQIPLNPLLIGNVEKNINDLLVTLTQNKNDWIKLLGINLLNKCFIMRLYKNNHIGAGGDHMIAYALESYIRENNINGFRSHLSHGELVYLGCVTMSALFPEWDSKILSLNKLISSGKKIGLLNSERLDFLIKNFENGLISTALRMRPDRPTNLAFLSNNRVENARRELKSYT